MPSEKKRTRITTKKTVKRIVKVDVTQKRAAAKKLPKPNATDEETPEPRPKKKPPPKTPKSSVDNPVGDNKKDGGKSVPGKTPAGKNLSKMVKTEPTTAQTDPVPGRRSSRKFAKLARARLAGVIGMPIDLFSAREDTMKMAREVIEISDTSEDEAFKLPARKSVKATAKPKPKQRRKANTAKPAVTKKHTPIPPEDAEKDDLEKQRNKAGDLSGDGMPDFDCGNCDDPGNDRNIENLEEKAEQEKPQGREEEAGEESLETPGRGVKVDGANLSVKLTPVLDEEAERATQDLETYLSDMQYFSADPAQSSEPKKDDGKCVDGGRSVDVNGRQEMDGKDNCNDDDDDGDDSFEFQTPVDRGRGTSEDVKQSEKASLGGGWRGFRSNLIKKGEIMKRDKFNIGKDLYNFDSEETHTEEEVQDAAPESSASPQFERTAVNNVVSKPCGSKRKSGVECRDSRTGAQTGTQLAAPPCADTMERSPKKPKIARGIEKPVEASVQPVPTPVPSHPMGSATENRSSAQTGHVSNLATGAAPESVLQSTTSMPVFGGSMPVLPPNSQPHIELVSSHMGLPPGNASSMQGPGSMMLPYNSQTYPMPTSSPPTIAELFPKDWGLDHCAVRPFVLHIDIGKLLGDSTNRHQRWMVMEQCSMEMCIALPQLTGLKLLDPTHQKLPDMTANVFEGSQGFDPLEFLKRQQAEKSGHAGVKDSPRTSRRAGPVVSFDQFPGPNCTGLGGDCKSAGPPGVQHRENGTGRTEHRNSLGNAMVSRDQTDAGGDDLCFPPLGHDQGQREGRWNGVDSDRVAGSKKRSEGLTGNSGLGVDMGTSGVRLDSRERCSDEDKPDVHQMRMTEEFKSTVSANRLSASDQRSGESGHRRLSSGSLGSEGPRTSTRLDSSHPSVRKMNRVGGWYMMSKPK